MTTIIRIEHPSQGLGVFQTKDSNGDFLLRQHSKYWDICRRHNDSSKFPILCEDKELLEQVPTGREVDRMRYAFNSMEMLDVAFTIDELKELVGVLGFKVLMLDITTCISSQYQTMFFPENIIQTKDISSLYI